MGVLICYKDKTSKKYCTETSVQDQLKDAEIVKVTVKDDNGALAETFLTKTNEASEKYVLPPVELKVSHGNTVFGAKMARQAKKLQRQIALRWAVGEIAKMQCKIDTRLSDIINFIGKR